MQYIQDEYNIDSFKYRHYNPGALKLLKPTQSINKLIGQTLNLGQESHRRTSEVLLSSSNVDYTYKPNQTIMTKPSESFIQGFKTQCGFRPKRDRPLNRSMKRQNSGGREIKSAIGNYENL